MSGVSGNEATTDEEEISMIDEDIKTTKMMILR